MSFLRRCGHWTWQAVVLSVLLLALLLAVVRGLVPNVADWRLDFESVASQALGQPLRLGDIRARINGWRPSIEARDVELLDTTGEHVALRAELLRLELDILGSLRNFSLRTGLIEIVGAQFSVQRTREGRVLISGLEADPGQDNTAIGQWLFSQPRLRLLETDIYWQDFELDDRTLYFQDVSFDLQNDAQRHLLAADLTLPPPWGGPMAVRMDMQGSMLQPEGRVTTLYFGASGLDLPLLLSEVLTNPVAITDGEAALEVWTHWNDGRITGASGQFDIEGWPRRGDMTGYTGKFRSEIGERDWRIDLQEVGARGLPFNAAMRYQWQEAPDSSATLQAASTALPVSMLREIAPSVLPPAANDLIGNWHVDGQVDQLQLQVHATSSPVQVDWGLYAHLADLQAPPSGHLPGFDQLGGELWVDASGGVLRLEERPLQLALPALFEQPLQVALEPGAELFWRQGGDGSVALSAPRLAMQLNGNPLATRLFLNWPADGSAPQMDLQAELNGVDVASVQGLLPTKIMNPRLKDWLSHGPQAGKMESAAMLWRGPLDGFPFKDAQGLFQARGDVHEAEVLFQRDWLPIKNGKVHLAFDNNAMHIRLDEGRLGKHTLSQVSADLERFKPVTPLYVKGRTRGDLGAALDILRRSPIGKRLPDELRNAKSRGATNVELALEIPMRRNQGRVEVKGKAELHNARLHLPDDGTELTALTGVLDFTRDHISSRRLRGQWRGIPMQAEFKHPFIGADELNIAIAGQLSDKHLQELVGSLGQHMQGEAEWQGQVLIPMRSDSDPIISVQSDLVGMQINAPEPLLKPKVAEIKVSGELRPLDHQSRLLQLKIGGFADYQGKLVSVDDGWRPVAQHLRFGDEPGPAEQEGITISGRLRTVPLDDWVGFLVDSVADGDGQGRQPPVRLDLRIDRLEALGDSFEDVQLRARADAEQLAATLASGRLAGSVDFNWAVDTSRPLSVKLSRLDLSKPDLASDGVNERGYSDVVPGDLPALAVDVDALSVGGLVLGKLNLRTLRVTDGMQITSARVSGPYTDLQASGDWLIKNGKPRSRLYVDMKTSDVGQLLERMGFDRSIAQGQGQLLLDGTAAAALPDVRLSDINGTFSVDLSNGRLPKVKPGVGRVFSLLDLGSIQRRLSLDFSDVVKEGLAFESIRGHFTLSDGDAYTNDLAMRGPAADIDISGRIGLLAQDYDQRVTVKPNLALTVPIAGTMVGGPAVGAALLLAQELIGSPAKEISKVEYSMVGDWDAPLVTRIRAPQESTADADLEDFEE